MHHPSENHISSTEYCEVDQRSFEFSQRRNGKKVQQYFYADLECDTRTSQYHRPIIAGVSFKHRNGQDYFHQFTGLHCVELLLLCVLRHINVECKQPVIGFHNLLYDFSASCDCYDSLSGAAIKDIVCIYVCMYGVSFVLIDTYKIIAEPLRKFKKMFDLPFGKLDMIPYSYYIIDLVDESGHRWVPMEQVASKFDKEEYNCIGTEAFIRHVEEDEELRRFYVNGLFDCVGYLLLL